MTFDGFAEESDGDPIKNAVAGMAQANRKAPLNAV